MYDFGKIRFIQEYEDSTVEHNIRGDATLDEVIEAFEMFLKGAGYHLKDGQHIGYEYEEDAFSQSIGDDQPYKDPAMIHWYDRMDGHSKHYWDTERNK